MIRPLLSWLLTVFALAFLGGWLFGRRKRRYAFITALILSSLAILSLLFLSGCQRALPAATPTPAAVTKPAPTAENSAATSPLSSSIATPTPEIGTLSIPLTGKVIFQSDRQGNFDLWLLDLSDMAVKQLTTATARDIEASWSPDGKQVVFASGRDDPDNLQLYVMKADGSQQHRLLAKVQKWDNWFPSWSPDGKKIIYQSNRNVQQQGFDLYMVNVNGSNEVQLTHSPADESHACWSPDGKQIAYTSNQAGNQDIWVMNADGSDPRPLTRDPADEFFPRWSPDGRQILFVSDRDGYQRLYLMNADGENQRRLSPVLPASDTMPHWAMSGKMVVFASNRANRDWEIYIMSVKSGQYRRLTVAFPRIMDRYPVWHR